MAPTVNPSIWEMPYLGMPFHFWTVVFFVFGTVVGSFLNVVIHRMPLDQSIVSPPSHCPHCNYSIPWYLNIPLFTWLYLKGKCAHCGAPIAIRYFLVELLTGLMFMACWLSFGEKSALLVLIYCLFISGLIAGTFIDFEHFIIPDQITLGGTVVGLLCSLVVPMLHGKISHGQSLAQSALGIVVGSGIIYGVLRMGKLLFGRYSVKLPPHSTIVFTETAIHLGKEEIAYGDLLYRKSDTIRLQATTAEMADRGYKNVKVCLTSTRLTLDDEEFQPENIPYLEVVTDEVILPREAMGLGDVKLMAAIGAFLGWEAAIFTLMASSVIGAVVGSIPLILKKDNASTRLPYVPYIAAAAVLWIFLGSTWWHAWMSWARMY